jgi:hypothetical protein
MFGFKKLVNGDASGSVRHRSFEALHLPEMKLLPSPEPGERTAKARSAFSVR